MVEVVPVVTGRLGGGMVKTRKMVAKVIVRQCNRQYFWKERR